MPDRPVLLQEYIWQELDLTPEYPQLKNFLHFWKTELDGPIHSVLVSAGDLVAPLMINAIVII